jgi:hypothetical protein
MAAKAGVGFIDKFSCDVWVCFHWCFLYFLNLKLIFFDGIFEKLVKLIVTYYPQIVYFFHYGNDMNQNGIGIENL